MQLLALGWQHDKRPPPKTVFLQKDIWSVRVTWIDSAEAIYVRSTDDSELKRISRSLNEFYKDKQPQPVPSPDVGDICLLFDEANFYRVQIESSINGIFNTQN